MKACARCNITVPSRTTLTIVTVTRYGHWWSIIVAVTSTLSRRHQCLSLPPLPHPLIFSVHSLRAKVATLTRLPNEPSFPPPPKPFESATFAKHRGGHFCEKRLIKSWRHATTVFQINRHWQAWRRSSSSKRLSPLFIPTHTLGITCLQGKRDY